jgi:hypothetical protein
MFSLSFLISLAYTTLNSMIQKYGFFSIAITALLCVFSLFALVIVRDRYQQEGGSVKGDTSDVLSPLVSELTTSNTSDEAIPNTPVSVLPVTSKITYYHDIQSSPTPVEPTIEFVDIPGELMEGGIATFTWIINGTPRTIHTTAVYYGDKSTPGKLPLSAVPADTGYSQVLKDFLEGDYFVPLRFVGSVSTPTPGTYFARAYALIEGQHYWSEERSFTVKQIPKHEIKIINRPTQIDKGGNAAFTWEITGPAVTTGFTTIVAGHVSKPGALDTSVDIPQTPYAILVKDFTSGTYNVPLRFIGNAAVSEPGEYYFRALAFINGKNIWSDEYSFTVE